MPIVIDKELYNLVKQHADEIYTKPSAYKSGYIVKTYKKNWEVDIKTIIKQKILKDGSKKNGRM